MDETTAEDEIWITRDGRRIAVSDMSEEHVRSTLRMLIRKARLKREAHQVSDVLGFLRSAQERGRGEPLGGVFEHDDDGSWGGFDDR